MDIKKGKSYLTEQDFKEYSIWKFNDADDLTYPISGPEDFPNDDRDLRIRAEFVTTTGIKLKGSIGGLFNIFCIVIYAGDKIFYFNKNLLKDCIKNIEKLGEIVGKKLTLADFSPLRYKTTIDLGNFKNIRGEFDLSKRRTDAERLGDVWNDE